MLITYLSFIRQVFLVRKISGQDAGTLYAMKVLKKATLKGKEGVVMVLWCCSVFMGGFLLCFYLVLIVIGIFKCVFIV